MHKQEQFELTPLKVELTPQQMILCENLASSQYGDKSKVENIIKDAIECYVTQQKELTKDNALFDKLSGLMLVSGFESALMQIMLKEIYCRDKKSVANYENIRSVAAMKMQKQFGEIHAVKELELQETIRTLHNEREELTNQIHVLTQEKMTLQEQYQNVYGKFTASESNYNDMAVALKSYEKLNQWQELRIKEVPKIRKKNSGIFKEQSWENAIETFEYYHKKPDVPKVKVK